MRSENSFTRLSVAKQGNVVSFVKKKLYLSVLFDSVSKG